jgi:hypothetical protein
MSTPFGDATTARSQAAENRRLAEIEPLANVRERLLRSAEVWDQVADQIERTKVAAAKNAAAVTKRRPKDQAGD